MYCSDTGCYLCLLILRRNANIIHYRESKYQSRLNITSLVAEPFAIVRIVLRPESQKPTIRLNENTKYTAFCIGLDEPLNNVLQKILGT